MPIPPSHDTSWSDIHAIILDFDGVIVDTEEVIYRAWVDLFEKHDASLPLDLWAQCVGSDHGAWDPKNYFEECTGLRPDWEKVQADTNVDIRRRLANEGPMPGVTRCLARWQTLGLPVAVASSSSHHWVDGWLDRLKLGPIHSTHCRDDVEKVKPAPDLFLHAADAMQTPPEKALVVEDSHNGMQAGLNAGMRVVAIPNRITMGQDFTQAWQRLESMAELAEKF